MPFLMVEAVLAPTVSAPVTSKIRQRIMACWYVTEREETLVAQAFATSSVKMVRGVLYSTVSEQRTGTVVVGLKQGKEGADGEDIGVLVKHLHRMNALKRCVGRSTRVLMLVGSGRTERPRQEGRICE